MTWDFDRKPYRPIEWPGGLPDVFVDEQGRLWYAGSNELRDRLPIDPLAHKTIPPQFWHPSKAKSFARTVHVEAKEALEDERIDNQLRLVP